VSQRAGSSSKAQLDMDIEGAAQGVVGIYIDRPGRYEVIALVGELS